MEVNKRSKNKHKSSVMMMCANKRASTEHTHNIWASTSMMLSKIMMMFHKWMDSYRISCPLSWFITPSKYLNLIIRYGALKFICWFTWLNTFHI